MASGVITAVPLLFFGASARRLPMTTIGLLQYFAPVLQFIVALVVFHEAMTLDRWIGFGVVWLALLVLTVDMLAATARARRPSGSRAGKRRRTLEPQAQREQTLKPLREGPRMSVRARKFRMDQGAESARSWSRGTTTIGTGRARSTLLAVLPEEQPVLFGQARGAHDQDLAVVPFEPVDGFLNGTAMGDGDADLVTGGHLPRSCRQDGVRVDVRGVDGLSRVPGGVELHERHQPQRHAAPLGSADAEFRSQPPRPHVARRPASDG